MGFFIEIDKEACKGCELCIPVCPKQVIEMGEHFNLKGWRYAVPARNEDCIGCKQCLIICPDVAIKLMKEE
jgi:2-oxoglutarate ferredoxin oxidoreductase subunit delta